MSERRTSHLPPPPRPLQADGPTHEDGTLTHAEATVAIGLDSSYTLRKVLSAAGIRVTDRVLIADLPRITRVARSLGCLKE